MALDTTFGTNGQGWTFTNNSYAINSQVIDSQNRTIVTGSTTGLTPTGKLFISRYTSDGLVDTTFGTDGYVYGDYYTDKGSSGNGIVLDENENILVTGVAFDDNDINKLLIAKYSSEGVIDKSFGGGKGWDTYDFDYPNYESSGNDIVLDSSGRILVTGQVINNGETNGSILFCWQDIMLMVP